MWNLNLLDCCRRVEEGKEEGKKLVIVAFGRVMMRPLAEVVTEVEIETGKAGLVV